MLRNKTGAWATAVILPLEEHGLHLPSVPGLCLWHQPTCWRSKSWERRHMSRLLCGGRGEVKSDSRSDSLQVSAQIFTAVIGFCGTGSPVKHSFSTVEYIEEFWLFRACLPKRRIIKNAFLNVFAILSDFKALSSPAAADPSKSCVPHPRVKL